MADRGRIKTAISVHSYDQQMLSPYGYTLELPPDYSEMVHYSTVNIYRPQNIMYHVS